MKPIQNPPPPDLGPHSDANDIRNLQDALRFLIEQGRLRLPDELRDGLLADLRGEREAGAYGGATFRIVTFLREQAGLEPGEIVDERTARALNRLLEEAGAFATPERWTIRGRVLDTFGRGLAGHTVNLAEYDLDGAIPVGSYTSRRDGSFEFTITPNEELQAGDDATGPDLILAVSDPAGNGLRVASVVMIEDGAEAEAPRLADSEQAPIVMMNVSSDLLLRVTVSPDTRALTEFEALVARLSPFMRQVSFADLKEDASNFQISFLSKETGIERAKIVQLRDAFQEERRSDMVPAWVFFGFANDSGALQDAAALPFEAFVERLKPLQPTTDAEPLADVAQRVLDYLKSRSFEAQAASLAASVGDALRPALGSEEKLAGFLDAYVRHDGDMPGFWQKMEADPDYQAAVPAIQLNLQLSQLTLNNMGLANALKDMGIADTRSLVDLAPETWEALALEHKAGIPAHITGEDDATRARAYAGELQALVEIAFPTDVIKKSLGETEGAKFLDRNPDFDFTRTPLESYLQARGDAAFEGIENRDGVGAQLRTIQRMYAVTTSVGDMRTLLDMGFESAHRIAQMPPEDFAREVEGKIAADKAAAYHAKAAAISNAAAGIYHHIRDLAFAAAPAAIQSANGDPSALKAIPNWENLFLSLEMCECEHCRSVYSPAAYFVDLLHILLGQNKGAARKELFRRRPDLMYTKLSCEHTETPIPYIDLVNEVLETYVAQNDVGNDAARTHAETSINDSSDLSAAELAANPQHPNPNSASDAQTAYGLLEQASFPLGLPFDMNLETAREFLRAQNSSRFEIMRTFGNGDSLAARAELLGLSEREFEILTGKKLDGMNDAGIDPGKDLWGSPPVPAGGGLGDALAAVNAFLERTGIAYSDLIALLSTRTLNPHFPIAVFLQGLAQPDRDAWLAAHPEEDARVRTVIELGAQSGDQCNLEKTNLRHLNGEVLSDEELSRFNRFIRLWKKLGCSISELDALLSATGAGDLTPAVIRELSLLWQVNQVLRLPLERLATLVGDIPASGKNSLYAKLFLNKAILQLDPDFTLDVAQTDLEKAAAEKLAGHVPAILAAFRISEEDLGRIATYAQLDLIAASLDLRNLSQIYRYVVFAKGLRMKVKDLMMWLGLVSPAPWATADKLLKTQELLARLQRYGFKAVDFAYIFQDVRTPGHSLPPSEDVITQSARMLRDGLAKIRQERTPPGGQVTPDFLKAQLGMLLEPDEAAKVVGILDGSNTQNSFNYLLAPKLADSYKEILQNYLSPADAAALSGTPDVADRLAQYWSRIEKRLLPVLRETFVKQHLIAALKAQADIVALMLQDAGILQAALDVESGAPAAEQAYAQQYVVMHKFTWLAGKLKLSGKELAFLQGNPNFGNFDWRAFDLAAWLRIADFAALRDSVPPAEKDLLTVFATADAAGDVADAIVTATGWNEADVAYFVSQRPADAFLNEIALITLQQQLAVSGQIGVSIGKLEAWTTDAISFDQAQDIKRTLKAKYDEDAWIEVSTTVHNRLRTRLRDALVAYLLEKLKVTLPEVQTVNDLYSYFLIDVEMDACMLTSRLKQAIASVQLFTQRCLLNLEAKNGVPPGYIDANQWKWMKNYRVWEANRKVFLYPENWIEPELRDNKSPFFRELESELLQVELTNEVAEQKLMGYLEKLDSVARLDICGIYEDSSAQELHVFGRTFHTPSQYFYRKLNLQSGVWTAWQRVQLDIQGNEDGDSAGVHLIPVIWNRRLYLFWPIFTEKPDKEKIQQDKEEYKRWKNKMEAWKAEVARIKDYNQQVDRYNADVDRRNRNGESLFREARAEYPPKPTDPEPIMETFPWAYYEVRLAWSEYRDNKWAPKQTSQSYVRTPSDRYGVAGTWRYRFSVELGDTLTIRLHYQPYSVFSVGQYQFKCNGKVTTLSEVGTPDALQVIGPKQLGFYQSFLSANSSGRAVNWNADQAVGLTLVSKSGKKTHDILQGSDKEYRLLLPADHKFSDFFPPNFIYQDQKRDYLVEYEPEWLGKVITGIKDRGSVTIPKALDGISTRPKITDGINPAWALNVEKFRQIQPAAVNQLVENGQLQMSTALMIRSTQVVEKPFLDDTGRLLTAPSFDIGARYFERFAASKPTLTFRPFFHAYICAFMEALNRGGIDGLLTLQNQQLTDAQLMIVGVIGGPLDTFIASNFSKLYRPVNVAKPYPLEEVDFSTGGAYSLYNWELFYHVPMLIANWLSKRQRFEEARRWYHFVFNPTTNEKSSSPARAWQVIPLRNTAPETLEALMQQLQRPASDPKRKELEAAIEAWRNNPFNPHLIARMRLIAYQKNAVMKYLDNLIAWADSLFRQDTMEAINEATQLYILAAEICGKRPEKVPARGKIEALNYAQLEAKGLDAFSNVLAQLETTFPFFNINGAVATGTPTASLLSTTAPTLYFCLPNNEKLIGYWDTIADRLFKIRHCQNIEGVERQLALFEPPIDPALLVRAAAGGVDISSVLADLNSPLPPRRPRRHRAVDISSVLADLNSPLPYYRFMPLLEKALGMCEKLQALGSNLLSALEKRDAEALSAMRSQHETMLLSLAKTVRKLQVTEAQRSREGLEKTRAVTELRAEYYAQLAQDGLNSSEKEHQSLSVVSMGISAAGQLLAAAASAAHAAPDVEVGAIAGPAGGATSNNRISGGDKIASALNAYASFFQMLAGMTSWAAGSALTNAGYQRRTSDWDFQGKLATKELIQIDKQIVAAEIREQIAEQELSNLEQQLDNARQVEEFLRTKYTQEELYGWLIGEASTIFFQCYQLAYDLAKKCEKAYRYELGLPNSSFVRFGIWDSFRKGLLSGENLYLSLKQMEKSYMDQNRREYEITKHVSLLQHAPLALIALRETGSCVVQLPESLFDLDYPGHYMRRIKSVSLTIPCVAGPYTSVNCTLTLLRSKTRVSPDGSAYGQDNEPEERVVTNFAAGESIATSSGQNDSGLFELNFRDERYLPFEGRGVASMWRIELPKELRQFDYETISDVVFRINYTAREGGVALRNAAISALRDLLKEESKKPQARLFSLRHDFPTEWHRLQRLADDSGDHAQAFSFDKQRFPSMFGDDKKKITINGVELFGVPNSKDVPALKLAFRDPDGQAINLQAGAAMGSLARQVGAADIEVKNPGPNGGEASWTIQVKKADVAATLEKLKDIMVLCQYTVELPQNV